MTDGGRFFVEGLLAMTEGGRLFVTSFLRMTGWVLLEIVTLMAYTLPKRSRGNYSRGLDFAK
jgi:hypothetical protein